MSILNRTDTVSDYLRGHGEERPAMFLATSLEEHSRIVKCLAELNLAEMGAGAEAGYYHLMDMVSRDLMQIAHAIHEFLIDKAKGS